MNARANSAVVWERQGEDRASFSSARLSMLIEELPRDSGAGYGCTLMASPVILRVS